MPGPRRQDEDQDEDAAALSHNPFRALGTLRDALPVGEPPKKVRQRRAPVRVTVSLQAKGPNGEEVTIISGLELKPKARETWLTSLKAELSCAGAADEERIVLRGDHRERLRTLLANRGVSEVTVTTGSSS